MEMFHDPVFWWALAASVWGVTSDYLGSNPRIKASATYQLLFQIAGQLIAGQNSSRRR